MKSTTKSGVAVFVLVLLMLLAVIGLSAMSHAMKDNALSNIVTVTPTPVPVPDDQGRYEGELLQHYNLLTSCLQLDADF